MQVHDDTCLCFGRGIKFGGYYKCTLGARMYADELRRKLHELEEEIAWAEG